MLKEKVRGLNPYSFLNIGNINLDYSEAFQDKEDHEEENADVDEDEAEDHDDHAGDKNRNEDKDEFKDDK